MIKKGTMWPWMAVIPPPNGWDFIPGNRLDLRMVPMPIVATQDHEEPPVVPSASMERIESLLQRDPSGISKQGRMAGKKSP